MTYGDVYTADAAGTEDLYYVDPGLYGTSGYGSIYVLDAERPALVDTGTGLRHETLLEGMRAVGVAPEEVAVIALTHVHLDHAGGAGYLVEACPDADVYVHERGARHLRDPGRLWAGTKRAVGEEIRFYAEPRPIPAERVRTVADGDRVDLGDHALVAHHAPGHAPHQVVYEDPANDGVFTGDAAGIYTPEVEAVQPTTPPPDFDLEACLADVTTIQALEPAALYYAHFGDFPAGDLLATYAEILQDWVDRVREARATHADDAAVAEALAAEATTEDAWGERKARAEVDMNVRGVCAYLDS